MAARLDTVCKFICERGDWRVTNLQLQKVLYLAQMIHMGRYGGEKITDAAFEAWDYGPVEPRVYRKVRMFGSGHIENVFYEALKLSEDSRRRDTLVEACDELLKRRAGELVEITHWDHGAWARWYEEGRKGIRIPDSDIEREYHDRVRAGNLRDSRGGVSEEG